MELIFEIRDAEDVPMHDPMKLGSFHGIVAEVAQMRSVTVESILQML
jgi:hypothetical protein